MKLILRWNRKICPCCKRIFHKKIKESKTQWKNRIWCSKTCKNIKIPIIEYTKQQLDYYLSNTITTSTGCIEWKGHLETCGYGAVHFLGKTKRLHRFIWEQLKGSIPNDAHVLHKCDNRKCINIDHLFLGTHQDNMKDMVIKKRHKHKLSEQDMKIIVKLKKEGVTYKNIAHQLNVSQPNISYWVKILRQRKELP